VNTTDLWKSRIVDYGEVDPKTILAHPMNPRTHPTQQSAALVAALSKLGWLEEVMVNRTTGRLVDGHDRVKQAIAHNEATVPVSYVELSPAEELLVLATLDAIAAMAVADVDKLEDLRQAYPDDFPFPDEATGIDLSEGESSDEGEDGIGAGGPAPEKEAPEDFPDVDEGLGTSFKCPACGYAWSGKPLTGKAPVKLRPPRGLTSGALDGRWRNRIVGHGFEDPEQLLANPLNFRIHPHVQEEALVESLDAVGWVRSVKVNQRTGHMVDGHERCVAAISAGESQVPVTYLDLDPDEERLALGTFDLIGAMAEVDRVRTEELMAQVGASDLSAILLAAAADYACPSCGHRWMGDPKP
jgi:ParB-like chromosome segregation protein Spo0J